MRKSKATFDVKNISVAREETEVKDNIHLLHSEDFWKHSSWGSSNFPGIARFMAAFSVILVAFFDFAVALLIHVSPHKCDFN